MTNQKLLELRKQCNKRRPEFKPQDIQKRREIKRGRWRKPKGMHSKMRDGVWGRPVLVGTGYRGPAEVRGLHISGLIPKLVHNPEQIAELNAKTQGIILGHIGDKKKIMVLNACKQKGITILNVKNTDEMIKKLTDKITTRKEAKQKTAKTKEEKTKQKTAVKPKEEAPKTKEEERKEAEKILMTKE